MNINLTRIFMLFFLILHTTVLFSQEGKKLFIYNFEQADTSKKYRYFRKSLARSVRVALRKKNTVNYNAKLLPRKSLLAQGYSFYIKGRFSVKNGKMRATFSIIELEKYMSVIVVIANGYPDMRMFDLIDNVSVLVNKTLEKSTSELLNKTVIMIVSKSGKVKVVTTDLKRQDLSGMIFVGTNFSSMDLSYTNFSGSELRNCNFTNSNLFKTNFSGANIVECDFENADIKQANFNDVFFYKIKKFRKAKNITSARIPQSTFDYIWNPKFQLGVTCSGGFDFSYFKYADYLSQESENETGYGYSIAARGIYYLTRNFGLMLDIGWEYLYLKEKFSSGGYGLMEYKIGNFYLNVYALLRFRRFIIYAGPYISTTVYLNKEKEYSYLFSNFGLSLGLGYLIPITVRFDILLSTEVKALVLQKWYEDNYGTIMSAYLSISFLFNLK